jgi:hypothetical protein
MLFIFIYFVNFIYINYEVVSKVIYIRGEDIHCEGMFVGRERENANSE